jgi:hypothetical protein
MSRWSSDAIRWAWRSPRLFAMTWLAVAVIVGAHYRFYRLDRWGMNSDEGVSWASASASTIPEVVAQEHQLDPGKLALYDVALDEWIREPTVRSSGLTKIAITRESACCFLVDQVLRSHNATMRWMAESTCTRQVRAVMKSRVNGEGQHRRIVDSGRPKRY